VGKNEGDGLGEGWAVEWCQFFCVGMIFFSPDLGFIWTLSRFLGRVIRSREKKDHRWVCQNWFRSLGQGFGVI
jgi:hypothetical protein